MKAFIGFITFVAFMLSSGCVAVTQGDKSMVNPGLLEPQAKLKLSDVPVPMGFKLIPQESYTFEASGVRVALLKYQGKVKDADQLVNFYKEQMAIYNWNLLNVIEYGQRLLNFDRESETCIISLLPKGSSAVVTISIGPKAQTALSKKNKPVK